MRHEPSHPCKVSQPGYLGWLTSYKHALVITHSKYYGTDFMKSCGLFATTTAQYYRYDTQIIILEFKLFHM